MHTSGEGGAEGRILVIDDEYGVRSGIRQILELEGYAVDEAGSGEQALRKLAEGSFDVALIDYRLPDIDGLTLLQGIKDRRLDIMTCMITAYANIDTAVAATRQGIDFFLPKPFLPDDLLSVIDTLLRHKRVRAEAERLRREHEASLLALAEEKSQTRSLVASLRDAVLVVNRDGEVALANRAMLELVRASESSVLRRPVAEVLGDEAFAPVREALVDAGRDRFVTQLELGETSFLVSVVAFRDDAGTVLGRIVTLSDISEVRRAAMEKARFVRTMVHEIRSPMGAIKSLIEVVLDKSLGDDLEPYLPMLERATTRIDALTELVGDLLSLSRIDMQRDVEREPLDAAAVAGEILDAERERMAARGITAAVEAAEDVPHVLVNAEDLRTILANLIGNAVKYNRDGGSVTVRVARDAEGAGGDGTGWLRIAVADTGIGIRRENLGHVFEEFYREKRSETRGLEGNGLGLSIVKRLVERAGGRLEVTSEEGKGSCFSVLLPV